MDVSAPAWVENRPTSGRRALDWRELWRYRELVAFLALRDVKVRYKQAAFGMLWAVVQPLAGLLVFTVVFHRLAKVPSDGVPYPLFALVGMTFWTLFSGGLHAATASLVANAALVTKVYFPRVAAPLAAVLPRLVDLGVTLALLAVLLLVTGTLPGPQVLLLPLVALWGVVLAFGVGLTFATVQVRFRDAHHALSLMVQLWLYASPVAYPSSLVPPEWRWAYALNPVAGLLDTARWVLLDTRLPGWPALLSLAVTVGLLVLGIRVFAAGERRFADVI
ncbi:MAG: O-antigen export system, permease protein [uncultured Frankineae bacterium]|uniref:Transport permease protein n=1 Tax=uncultured Frankineae bacterium TaxID=437475 RepID=A0A6J4LB38_9ACTN|nr:MAG: O-antigen export system, permease protein [uncultured Frankineae bacterium]